MKAILLAATILTFGCPAWAYDHNSVPGAYQPTKEVRYAKKQARVERRVVARHGNRHRQYVSRREMVHRDAVQLDAPSRTVRYLPHPSGCPRIAFCGCGAAVEVFGKPIRSLWLARAWYKFPRTSPAPGAVAVKRHHVFVLRQHVGGDRYMVADFNSGGRRSRLHVRSIAGYTIVNPRAGLASL